MDEAESLSEIAKYEAGKPKWWHVLRHRWCRRAHDLNRPWWQCMWYRFLWEGFF